MLNVTNLVVAISNQYQSMVLAGLHIDAFQFTYDTRAMRCYWATMLDMRPKLVDDELANTFLQFDAQAAPSLMRILNPDAAAIRDCIEANHTLAGLVCDLIESSHNNPEALYGLTQLGLIAAEPTPEVLQVVETTPITRGRTLIRVSPGPRTESFDRALASSPIKMMSADNISWVSSSSRSLSPCFRMSSPEQEKLSIDDLVMQLTGLTKDEFRYKEHKDNLHMVYFNRESLQLTEAQKELKGAIFCTDAQKIVCLADRLVEHVISNDKDAWAEDLENGTTYTVPLSGTTVRIWFHKGELMMSSLTAVDAGTYCMEHFQKSIAGTAFEQDGLRLLKQHSGTATLSITATGVVHLGARNAAGKPMPEEYTDIIENLPANCSQEMGAKMDLYKTKNVSYEEALLLDHIVVVRQCGLTGRKITTRYTTARHEMGLIDTDLRRRCYELWTLQVCREAKIRTSDAERDVLNVVLQEEQASVKEYFKEIRAGRDRMIDVIQTAFEERRKIDAVLLKSYGINIRDKKTMNFITNSLKAPSTTKDVRYRNKMIERFWSACPGEVLYAIFC